VNKLVYDPPTNRISADFLRLCTEKCVSELTLWERDMEMTRLDANAVLSFLFSYQGCHRRKLSLKGVWFPADFFEILLQVSSTSVVCCANVRYSSFTEKILSRLRLSTCTQAESTRNTSGSLASYDGLLPTRLCSSSTSKHMSPFTSNSRMEFDSNLLLPTTSSGFNAG
jgi:hypothetical protein